jgi:hypothetical protein
LTGTFKNPLNAVGRENGGFFVAASPMAGSFPVNFIGLVPPIIELTLLPLMHRAKFLVLTALPSECLCKMSLFVMQSLPLEKRNCYVRIDTLNIFQAS